MGGGQVIKGTVHPNIRTSPRRDDPRSCWLRFYFFIPDLRGRPGVFFIPICRRGKRLWQLRLLKSGDVKRSRRTTTTPGDFFFPSAFRRCVKHANQ